MLLGIILFMVIGSMAISSWVASDEKLYEKMISETRANGEYELWVMP